MAEVKVLSKIYLSHLIQIHFTIIILFFFSRNLREILFRKRELQTQCYVFLFDENIFNGGAQVIYSVVPLEVVIDPPIQRLWLLYIT